jgi:hypothetical protein
MELAAVADAAVAVEPPDAPQVAVLPPDAAPPPPADAAVVAVVTPDAAVAAVKPPTEKPAEKPPVTNKPKEPKGHKPHKDPKASPAPKDERTIEQLVDAGEFAKANTACATNTQFSTPRLVACATAACNTGSVPLATRWIRAIPRASRDEMAAKCKSIGLEITIP